jgi:hypothetical protein
VFLSNLTTQKRRQVHNKIEFTQNLHEILELITAHLNRLGQNAKNLLFITDTITIEKYVLAAQKQIEANLWTWLVFTKDTLPFKCLQCDDAQIYWARVVKSTASEE